MPLLQLCHTKTGKKALSQKCKVPGTYILPCQKAWISSSFFLPLVGSLETWAKGIMPQAIHVRTPWPNNAPPRARRLRH